MPTIRTICPSCRGDVLLEAGHCALLGGHDGQPVAYAFVCPDCGEPVVRRADRRAAALLTACGASPRGVRERAARFPHPEQPGDGPPLTADDLIDFHMLLADPHWAVQPAPDAPPPPPASVEQ
ncbi:MAG TPA: hypothetical protein VM324_10810 [Egibacteraceae bacterium]|nr:hypothetical protein [Egibacteraceae bacterium]